MEAGIVYTVNGQSFSGKTKMAGTEKRRGYGGPVAGCVCALMGVGRSSYNHHLVLFRS